MRSDKAFVEFEGQTLLERALSTARAITPTIGIVGDKRKFAAYGVVVEDIFRDRGPLGGIHAALASTTTDLNLVLAVDLPLINAEFLHFLVKRAECTDALVTVPHAGGRYQPLCAVYRQQFAPLAERSLEQGSNKIDTLFHKATTRVIEELELLRNSFSPQLFRNVNTPEELEQVRGRSFGER